MHQHRRRKKRPSYGIRTVEITRGKNGFGFTISGQAPCIFSCIITGSPAEKAGLKTGDFLIAVNGQNVSKALHDDVVRLIGNSNGIIKLQIAANYYSDSSDEDFASVVKLRPKYPHKARHRQLQNSVSRAEKVVQDLKTGALFVDHVQGTADVPQKQNQYGPNFSSVGLVNCSRSNKALLDLILQQPLPTANRISLLNINSQKLTNLSAAKFRHPVKKKELKVQKKSQQENVNTTASSPAEVFHSIFTEQDLNSILYPAIFAAQNQYKKNGKSQEQVILKTVVGYLGTIEMPKESQLLNSRLQTIRNCIRRLRIEKKVHTLVLMTVFPECIVLISPENLILAEFAADKITFCGVYSDDKKFFGLVTNHGTSIDDVIEESTEDSIFLSSSCHVFMVDPKLTPHHQHVKIAKAFHITCTSDTISNKCKEFPDSADCILQAVVGLYRSKMELNVEGRPGLEFHASMSPQPSNTSSNSSNSDSGIGFRDEGFLLPDASLCSLSMSQENGFISSKSASPPPLSSENKTSSTVIPSCQFNRLTVRAMPDPVGFDEHFDTQSAKNKNCTHKFMHEKDKDLLIEKDLKNCVGASELQHEPNYSLTDLKNQKLSPKVYDLSFPLKLPGNGNLPNDVNDSIPWKCADYNIEDIQRDMLHQMHHICDESNEKHDVCSAQSEWVSLSENSENTHDLEISKKWGRTSSLRRCLGRKRSLLHRTHEAGTVSDGELANGSASTSSSMLAFDRISHTSLHSCCTSDRPIHGGRAASWAESFTILLEDPAGLHAFSEFLKKEFSEENIMFWIACEQYRQIKDQAELVKMAQKIYTKHLCIGAQEPVNVDSHARQIAQGGLDSPTPDLFLPAQKQIFNLMKFDCYQRFLKSSIFQDSIFYEMQGKPLPYQDKVFELGDSDERGKRKVYNEEKKKKSLIPWHKLSKSRHQSKCKGRKFWERHGEVHKSLKKCKDKDFAKLDDSSSLQSDVTSSRSSLTGSETERGTKIRNRSRQPSAQKAVVQNKIMMAHNERINACMEDTLSRLTDWSTSQQEYLEAEKGLKSLSVYPDLETLTNQIFEDLLKNQPEFQCSGLEALDINSNDEKKGIKPQVIF